MRLNSFFNKDRSNPKKSSKSFVLSNDAKEQKLQAKIDALQTEVNKFHDIQSINDELKKKADHAFKEQKKAMNMVADLEEIRDKAELELSDLRPKANLLPQVQKTLHEAEQRSLNAVQDLNEIKISKKAQEKNIDFLSKERMEFKRDYDNEVKKTRVIQRELQQVADTNKETQKKYAKLKSFADNISKINIEKTKTIEQLEIQINYLEQDNEGARKYMSEVEAKKDEALELLEQVNSDSLKQDSKERLLSKKLTDLSAELLRKVTEYNNLKKELDYVSSLAKTFKAELDKPRYMSVESISRKEGFSIPGIASAKNYSKLHLGNAKPTLLKFK